MEKDFSQICAVSLMESFQEGILVADTDGSVCFVNQKFCTLLQVPMQASEITGTHGTQVLKSHQPFVYGFNKFIETVLNQMTEKIQQTGKIVPMRDGRYLEIDYHPIFSQGHHTHHFWRYRDITDAYVSFREMEEQLQETLQANVTKNTLLAVLSHDMQSPIHTLEAMLSICGSMTYQEMNLYSTEIKKAVNTTASLLDNLLQWSRLHAQSMVINAEKTDLAAVTDESIDLIHTVAAQKGNRLMNNISDSLIIKADRSILRMLLRNLLSNANKFTSAGEITVRAFV